MVIYFSDLTAASYDVCSRRMDFLESAIIGLLLAIGLLNSIISLRMRSEVNTQLPPADQLPWWWRGLQIKALRLHKQFFPESSLRFWWWYSLVGAFALIGVLLYLGNKSPR